MTPLQEAMTRAHAATSDQPCVRCQGTGQFKQFGPCFRCRGKGVLTTEDRRRNAKYDSHALRDDLQRAFDRTGQLALL